MPPGYDYALSRAGLEAWQGLSSSERRVLLDFFERLAMNPFLAGDYSFRDAVGHDNQVFDLGGFIVAYWTDHAASEVRILSVERD